MIYPNLQRTLGIKCTIIEFGLTCARIRGPKTAMVFCQTYYALLVCNNNEFNTKFTLFYRLAFISVFLLQTRFGLRTKVRSVGQ